ncbi:MAG TPA: DUF4125 family protein [Desulfobacteraceae bacterium]|nr:MAG: DUF4125 domain-containing protein [Deltaproteobacteria bacterium]HDL07715.1 DUF4125 family protein [Desulfobacteraceae bacterium]
MSRKDDLIMEILNRELKMFLSVPTQQKASCQEHPEDFKLVRGSQFQTWSEDTLESYIDDLKAAEKNGVNLMTQKYARMDNLIPKLKDIPVIDEIVKIQYAWQKEMFENYPNVMSKARPLSSSEDTSHGTSFETYLKGELETYSDKTLSLLYRDIKESWDNEDNMTERVYDYMVKKLEYDSLDDAEETVKRQKEAEIS